MIDKKALRFGEREFFAFEASKRCTFTTAETKGILGGTDASAKNVLKRLKRKRRVKVKLGKYLFAPMQSGRKGEWSWHPSVVVPEEVPSIASVS